jgi:hypothetical protein
MHRQAFAYLRALQRPAPIRNLNNSFNEVASRTTRTKKRQQLFLPKQLTGVLCWHVEQQIAERIRAESDLLFPSETGGLRSRSVLDRPFREVGEAIELGQPVRSSAATAG